MLQINRVSKASKQRALILAELSRQHRIATDQTRNATSEIEWHRAMARLDVIESLQDTVLAVTSR